MMEVICYVCNEETSDWHRNLMETKSKHTKTPIVQFITMFLGDFMSQRNINDESNCICSECLIRIQSYDWMCVKLKEQEKELRTLILKTESNFTTKHIKQEFEFINSTESVQAESSQGDRKDIKFVFVNPDDKIDDTESVIEISPAVFLKPEIFDEDDGDDDDKNQDDLDDDWDIDDPPEATVEKSQQQKSTTTTKTGSKICEFCDEKLKHVKTMKLHEKIHTKSPGMLTCHICMYKISDKEKDPFKDHVRKHSKNTAKHCVICNERGSDDFDLKHHVQSQHNATLSCTTCGKSFVYASALRVHLRSHIELLSEQCTHCKKAFPDKESLEIHMRTHVQAVCTICGKKFTRKEKCKIHELKHTNDSKKFKCTLCPSAVDTERGLKLHLIRKHKEEELDHME